MLNHEKLDVYQCSIEFVELSATLVKRMPRGYRYLRGQLERAATSIVLNIAEGNGKATYADRANFFNIARASASECGAALDICSRFQLIDVDTAREGKELLERIYAMLTAMINQSSRSRSSRS